MSSKESGRSRVIGSRHPARASLVAAAIVAALAATAPSAHAQSTPTSVPASEAQPTPPARLDIPAAARATPDFDPERATEAWLATIPPEARQKSDSYFEGGYWLQLVDWLWGIGIAALLLSGGRARRVRDAIRGRIRWSYVADLATAAVYLLAVTLLSLPLTVWEGFVREHAYGLSNQTLPQFFGDWAKGVGVGLLFGSLAIAAVYGVVRRAPRTWWLWGTAVAMLFLMLGAVVAPVWIAPLFNHYRALEPGTLRDQILAMARSYEIPADEVYWFDASKQTKRVSANVSGLLGTTRISLNDNLLRRSPRETILAVLGHEMGHYVLDHVSESLIDFSLVIAAGFAFLHFGFGRLARRFRSWRLESVADPAGLPLAMALLATFFLVATPVTNAIIRSDEAEADAFGLAASREPDGFAFAAVQLSEYRKMRPGPLEEIVFYDHPSGYHRIHRAMIWKSHNLAECAAREAAADQRLNAGE
jgi:STE24 endopeptidase